MKKLLMVLVSGLLVGTVVKAECKWKDFGKFGEVAKAGGPISSITFATITFPLIGSTYGSAKASGSSGCGKSGSAYIKQLDFVATTIDNLSEDIAQGGGPHLQSLAALLGCPASDYPALAGSARRDFGRLFPTAETKPAAFLTRLKDGISHDSRLSVSCVYV